MSELIGKQDGNPFETEKAAKTRQTIMAKDGIETKVVEVEGGWKLEETGRKRAKRRPVGRRNVLTMREEDKNPDYVYRVFNDKDGRILQAEGAWWEVVKGDIPLGDYRVTDASQKGTVVSKPVGGGVDGVLMRIKKEYYEEDQAEKQKKIDEVEAEMRRRDLDHTTKNNPNARGEYGSVDFA